MILEHRHFVFTSASGCAGIATTSPDAKRDVVRADEELTPFVELEFTMYAYGELY